MPKYTFQAGAHWPNSLIDLTNYRDADNTVGPLIAQIKAYQEAGNYEAAQAIIIENAQVLKQYALDASAINKYVEELRNLEIYTKSRKQQIFYTTEEEMDTFGQLQDVWLGDVGDSSEIITSGTALDSQVLEGATFLHSDGTIHTGTMIDNGAVSAELSAGERFTIPAGYHNGGGVIAANGGVPSGGTINLGTHSTNGLKKGFDVSNYAYAEFRVNVPTVMTGTIEAINGKLEVQLDRDITNFLYITGYASPTSSNVHYFMKYKTADGKWKNGTSRTDYGITALSGNKFTLRWDKTATFTYYAW